MAAASATNVRRAALAEAFQAEADEAVHYWADYFADGTLSMARDSAPLTTSFCVDPRLLDKRWRP